MATRSRSNIDKEFQALISHAQNLVKATAGEVDERTKEARVRLENSLDSVRARYDVMEKHVADGLHVADDYIQERPYQSIGVSFVVGLLVGWLTGRK